MRISVLAITLAVIVAACGTPPEAGSTDTTTTPAAPTTIEVEEPVTSTPGANTELVPTAVAARVDLASRLEVAERDIEITSLALVNWRDGSIGCPEEGMSYTQALVPGALVTLVYAGNEYSYHQGGDGDVFLCENPVEGSFNVSEKGNDALELIPPPGFDE